MEAISKKDFHYKDHQELAMYVSETVDYGSKISALQQECIRQEEKIKELGAQNEKEERSRNMWFRTLSGVIMILMGAGITMYSDLNQAQLRFERNERQILNHSRAFDELYDRIAKIETEIEVIKTVNKIK